MLQIFSRTMRSAQLFRRCAEVTCTSSTRNLNLLEYQSKELLRDSGVSVQNFTIVDDLTKTNSALEKLRECLSLYIYLKKYIFFYILKENYAYNVIFHYATIY